MDHSTQAGVNSQEPVFSSAGTGTANSVAGGSSQARDLLDAAKTVLVILTPNPTYDQVASACSLYLSASLMGKSVSLVSPVSIQSARLDLESAPVAVTHLSGIDGLRTDMGNKNLVIGFEYNENSVDKVDYHIGEETGKFYLTIKPKQGYAPIDSSSVDFSYTGADADIIFTIGVSKLESLEQLYVGFESLYSEVPVVSIHSFETDFGSVKLDISSNVCMASAMYRYLGEWGLPMNADIATNLLSSIEQKTSSFSAMNMTADVFDAVAQLMRAGARRVRV